MTIEEYMNPMRFPATTQKGLKPSEQLMIDAVNYDQLRQYLEDGGQPDEDQRGRWRELEKKMPHNGKLAAELAKPQQPKQA